MNARQTEKKVNAIVDEILNEEQENGSDATRAETCPCGCEELHNIEETTQCRCGVENSSRFSLRVMEAMRSLQRDVDLSSTSTAEEIADYIRSHYRHDGDLNAQVRTALRQVCSQGFVMELLSNEYHLIGPVARSTKRNCCSLDCTDRMADDASRSRRNGVCDCTRRFPRRSPRPQYPKTSIVDRPEGHRAGEFNADVSDIRDSRHDTVETEQRTDSTVSISGSFRNAKRARVEDEEVQRADEDDDETTTEEDVTRDEYSRIRPPNRPYVIRNHRNERRRDEEGEEDEERERIEEDDEEDDGMEEEDEDRGPRARVPLGKAAARKRELRRWIRKCRQECERRRGR